MTFESTLPSPVIKPWTIVVTKAKTPTRFICMSKVWINFMTHWWGGHTVICCKSANCEPCKAGVRKDYRAFVGGKSLQSGQYAIVSLTASSCDMLEKFFLSKRGLQDLSICLHRVPARDTGMLHAMTHGYVEKGEVLQKEQLEDMLSRIFSLNQGKEVNLSAPLDSQP